MKKELKRKYLSFNYRKDIYLKIQNFKQQDLSVEEYSTKIEEICISHIIVGLRSNITKVIIIIFFCNHIIVFKM